MKTKSTLKHIQEQVTYLLNKYNVSIRTKIFLGVGLFVILNIIINLAIVKLSINDIYIGLEKSKLKKEYLLVKKNLNNYEDLTNVIYHASEKGIKIKVLDNNLNVLYTIFNDKMFDNFNNTDLVLLESLKNSKSKIISVKSRMTNRYNLYLVGKTSNGYTIISSSIESVKQDAKTTTIILLLTSFVTFLILIGISYFISKLFGKKINEIKEVTDGITNLNFDKRIEVKTNDELGDLFNNINEMSSKLQISINELELANEKLKQDLIDKEKQEKARKKLVANISHEFKTPLTIISGYSQLLKEEVKGKDNIENLELIIEESERLSELVKEFLQLSKLESGSIKLNKENIDAKEIIEEEIKKLNVKIKSKKVKVKTEFIDNQNILVDKKQFSKVVENLLTNAIKFCSNEKQINIKTYTINGYFYYEVFNTGKNIKDSDIENIFSSYYKDKSERNKEGTGLGLTIVKAIVDLHEGMCYVENKDNGVCFKVSVKI